MTRPDPSNVTVQLPQTNAKTSINLGNQKPSTLENNPQPLENAPVHASTPWPEAGKMSGNLFELRKDWPIPPTNNTVTDTNPKLPIKIEPQEPNQQTSSTTAPRPEQCGWGPNCPIYKNVEEDWDGKHQKQFQQANKNIKTLDTQQNTHNPQCTQDYQIPQNPQPTWMQSFDVPDRYMEQIHLRREWEEKMERLNEKYRLDCFSDSELDSELNKGKNYQYEHKYETLI